MKFNTIAKVGLAAILGMSMVGCSSSTASSTDSKDETQNIIIAISPDYPPFDDLTTDGELTGFDYDMGEWLFTWLEDNGYNYTHEWKSMSFDTVVSAIHSDQVDLGISGITYEEERQVLFSDPYYSSTQVALVTADSELTSSDELEGLHLGYQLGATTPQTIAENLSDDTEAMSDMGIIIETLKSGGLDAVILDNTVAQNYAATGDYKVLDGVLNEKQVHIIAKLGNDALMDDVNAALEAFMASDDYQKLLDQYGM